MQSGASRELRPGRRRSRPRAWSSLLGVPRCLVNYFISKLFNPQAVCLSARASRANQRRAHGDGGARSISEVPPTQIGSKRASSALNLLLTLTILYLVTPSALATARFEYARPLQELTI